jgi:ATP/ADP translocase/HEAT repeat protein
MALYHFVLLITLYLLKPLRDSLFLSGRGAEELPLVFMLTTVAVVPVAVMHTRFARSLHVGRLVDGVSLFLAASLLGVHWLIGAEGTWSTYVLYAWVSIYGLLVTSQFWLFANTIFAASQAKRVFTVLSVGAILGAVSGGEITGLLVDDVGLRPRNLLWVAAALIAASVGLARYIRHRSHLASGERGEPADDGLSPNGQSHAADASTADASTADASTADASTADASTGEPDPESVAEDAASQPPVQDTKEVPGAGEIIFGSRHIQLIVGVIALTVITTTFIDYQFKTVAAQAFAGEEALTTFMGRFYGRVSLVALFLQFFLAPRLMKVVGIGGALSILPLGLALGTVGMIALPGLVAGVLLRGTDQSLKHSIDKTGRELLYVPLSIEKKKRVKVFVDLFVDQGAQGLGGALLLGLTMWLGLDVQALAVVTLGLLAVWGYLAYRARHSYVDQFRRKLREQERETTQQETPQGDGQAGEGISANLDELLRSLCSHNEAEALRALTELEENHDLTVPVDALRCLLDHQAEAVRAQVIRVMRVRGVNDQAQVVAERLLDTDPDVQLEAARYLHCSAPENRMQHLQAALSYDDLRIQAAAVGLIAEEGGPREYRLVTENHLRRLMDADGDVGEDARTHVARILGVLDRDYREELLEKLLRDDSMQVQRAAIEAAGRTGDRAFVHVLLQRLQSEAVRKHAHRALVRYGQRILGTTYDHLVDPEVDLTVRRRIPAIVAEQSCQIAATVLTRSLGDTPVPVRHAVTRALSRLHAGGSYRFDEETIDAAIRSEARHYAALGQILHLRERAGNPEKGRVNTDALRSLREECLERIFRLLGLRYDQRDIYDAYLGITSGDATLRSSAVEFVDNLIGYNTSRYLLPLLDDEDGRQAAAEGPSHFDLRIRSWERALQYVDNADDPRLDDLFTSPASPGRIPSGDGYVHHASSPSKEAEVG